MHRDMDCHNTLPAAAMDVDQQQHNHALRPHIMRTTLTKFNSSALFEQADSKRHTLDQSHRQQQQQQQQQRTAHVKHHSTAPAAALSLLALGDNSSVAGLPQNPVHSPPCTTPPPSSPSRTISNDFGLTAPPGPSLDPARAHQHLPQSAFKRHSTGRTLHEVAAAGPLRTLETTLSCNSFFYSLHDAIAAVNAHDDKGWTPLHYAVKHGNIKAATLLLQHHASPNAIILDGGSSSIPNTKHSNKDEGSSHDTLVSPDSICSSSSQGSSTFAQLWTPLHLAAWTGSEPMLELLVMAGAALEAPDQAGNRPLHVAVSRGHAGAAHCLLELGADAAASKAGSRDTAAHLAAAAERLDLLAMLQLYADDDNALTVTNAAGTSPLMVLAASGQLEQWLELCLTAETTAATLRSWM